MRAGALLLPVLLAACPLPPPAAPVLAWRLVEIDVTGGRELVLDRDEPPPPTARIEVRLSRDWAAVGEVVEADVWIPDSAGARRIEVRPGRPGVRLLGPAEFEVTGTQVVRVRFTCSIAGRGGIVVIVRD